MVVMVLAIIAGLAAPMFADRPQDRLSAAARLLASDLAYAQADTLTHTDDPRVVVFDKTNDAYHLAATSALSTPLTRVADQQPYMIDFGDPPQEHLAGVTLGTLSVGGDDELGFGPYGELDQAADATIVLEDSGESVTVTVDADTGEARVGP